jgi:hypothetical protein
VTKEAASMTLTDDNCSCSRSQKAEDLENIKNT